MYIADNWKDYEVLDTGNGEKLERWGDYVLIRPDPQVIWTCEHEAEGWKKAAGHYHRSSKGGGEWEFHGLPQEWSIHYDLSGAGSQLTFNLKPFAFKHTGVFPEQAVNWEWTSSIIKEETSHRSADDPVRVLNLFAYTGGATLASLAAGASVTHVDASKGMVGWAKENAISSRLSDKPVRWLVDDCNKFVEREIRRGNRYDAIIMDPPSYGRGPKGEIWKMEDCIYLLLENCAKLLSDRALFFLINSYTTGLQAGVLDYMMGKLIVSRFGGKCESDEVGLPVSGSKLVLPCGASGRWRA
ncbi:MAG: class I SAM-dependent methyltransferase [Lachnospiraceae bacterium]|nr:class I SAM-dependent methyltransferase [Lachnospiraceae bacterium]